MKSKFLSLTLVLLVFFGLNLKAQKNRATVLKSDGNETVVKFNLNSYNFVSVNTDKGKAKLIKSGKLSSMMQKGAPDLIKFSRAIIIPDFNSNEVEIIDAKYTDISDILIAPSKGNLKRSVNPADVPYEYGKVYNQDSFFPGELASLNTPFIERDHRGQVVNIYPFQYNPAKRTLRVYSEITVAVKRTNKKGVNEYTYSRKNKVSEEFSKVYQKQFLNYNKQRYTPVEEAGEMLVICHDEWVDAMKPFVDWKNATGRKTVMVKKSEAGTDAATIKAYVKNYYETNGLTYLLLVGDAEQIPSHRVEGSYDGDGDSDNTYGYLAGDDHYLEIFVGRFSSETQADVENQVKKIIDYENGATLTEGWLNETLGIASNQGAGSGDDGEADYQHMRNIKTDLLGYNYTKFFELYDGSQSGDDAIGDPTPAMVEEVVNNGVGFINYVGHGNITVWGTSGFSNKDVNKLKNIGKLPYVFSVACLNGNFVGKTCFSEAWMRANDNGKPTGAVAFVGSTVNQHWQPPMKAQDEFTDILVGSYENNIKRTFGGLFVNSLHLMNDESNTMGFEMTDTWVCFSDPSLYVRTDNPTTMTVNHIGKIIAGTDKYTVTVAEDITNGVATLSKDGMIKATGKIENGKVDLDVSDVVAGEILKLTVTGYNKVTYIDDDVKAIVPDGAYVIVKEYATTINSGQTLDLKVKLENIGNQEAKNITTTLTLDESAKEYVTLTNNIVTYPNMATNAISEASADGKFTLTAKNNIPNNINIPLKMTINFDGLDEAIVTNLNVKTIAPQIKILKLEILDPPAGDDDPITTGNKNSVLDPGETLALIMTVKNIGNLDVSKVSAKITTENDFLEITQGNFTDDDLTLTTAEDGATKIKFYIKAKEDAFIGSFANVSGMVEAGVEGQYSDATDYDFIVGYIPEYCESSAGYPSGGFISEFTFGELHNNTMESDNYQYSDYTTDTELMKSFMPGGEYEIAIKLSTRGGSYSYQKAAKVYVDWNYDGDFNDPGETIFTVKPTAIPNIVKTGVIKIPEGVTKGPRFLRIVLSETVDANQIKPCGVYQYGETEDYRIEIVDPKKPEPEFNISNETPYVNEIVRLTDLSKYFPNKWEWDITPGVEGTDFEFLENTTAESKNPVVKFKTIQTFKVKLKVSNIAGNDSIEMEVPVKDIDVKPIAKFKASEELVSPSVKVRFTDLSENVPDGWTWTITSETEGAAFKFVDNTTANSQNPVVKFTKEGFYNIQLVATNKIGDSEPKLETGLIEVIPGVNLTNNTTPPHSCRFFFYDPAGPNGPYSADVTVVNTLYPESEGKAVKLEFLDFDLEAKALSGCWDVLEVYNASSVNDDDKIGEYCGDKVPEGLKSLEAKNVKGALTFKFKSDPQQVRDGWKALVSCVDNKYHNLTFNVTNGVNPIEKAKIKINDDIVRTNEEGVAVFKNIKEGFYSYTVTAKKHKLKTGTVEVSASKEITVELEPKVTAVEEQDANIFKLYPNPTNGLTEFAVKAQGNVKVTVFNITGQIVKQKEFKPNTSIFKTTLNLSDLEPGIYPVVVNVNGKKFFEKLIVY